MPGLCIFEQVGNLVFENIRKSFSEVQALSGVSFEVPSGSLYGLLGPNGAGKTTLIRIITNIIAADTGRISFNGQSNTRLFSHQIGYMPEEKGMYRKMKVGEHLIYLARLKGLDKKEARQRIEHWFDRLKIDDWWQKSIRELSKGMQQKVQFIATVIHQPEILILDEPFSGLDPVNTELLKEQIFYLNREGVTILFSTHRMEQVEEICQRVVLINKGSILVEGDIPSLKDRYKQGIYVIEGNGKPFDSRDQFEFLTETSGRCRVQLKGDTGSNAVLESFLKAGWEVKGFREELPSLNEIFIDLVNNRHNA